MSCLHETISGLEIELEHLNANGKRGSCLNLFMNCYLTHPGPPLVTANVVKSFEMREYCLVACLLVWAIFARSSQSDVIIEIFEKHYSKQNENGIRLKTL